MDVDLLWKDFGSTGTLGEMLVVSLADRASDVPPSGHFQAEGETPVAASSHPWESVRGSEEL